MKLTCDRPALPRARSRHDAGALAAALQPHLECLVVMSVRYALPRRSTASSDATAILSVALPHVSDATLAVLAADLRRALEQRAAGDPAIDGPLWQQALADITDELAQRPPVVQ